MRRRSPSRGAPIRAGAPISIWLFERHGSAPRVAAHYPATFDELAALNIAVAGSPQTVRDFIAAEIEATGLNYFVPWLAFGDMTLDGSPALGRSVRPRGHAGVRVTGSRDQDCDI